MRGADRRLDLLVRDYRNVTASYGVNGFIDDHRAAFERHGTERIYIAEPKGGGKTPRNNRTAEPSAEAERKQLRRHSIRSGVKRMNNPQKVHIPSARNTHSPN